MTSGFNPLIFTVTAEGEHSYKVTAILDGAVYLYNDECLEKTNGDTGPEVHAANDNDYPPADCPYQQKVDWYGIFVR